MTNTERNTIDLVEVVRSIIMGIELHVNVDEGWRTLENSVNAATIAVLAALEPHIRERERAAKVELLQEWKSNAILQSRYADEVKNELDVIVWNTIAILFNRYEAAARDESTTDTEREDE